MRTRSDNPRLRRIIIGSTALGIAVGASVVLRKLRAGIRELDALDIFGAPEGGTREGPRNRTTDEYEEAAAHAIA